MASKRRSAPKMSVKKYMYLFNLLQKLFEADYMEYVMATISGKDAEKLKSIIINRVDELKSINSRLHDIISMRYEDQLSLADTAKEFGITSRQVNYSELQASGIIFNKSIRSDIIDILSKYDAGWKYLQEQLGES